MAGKAYVFDFDIWYMNKQEDWEADFYYLVYQDGNLHQLTSGSLYHQREMEKQFPDREIMGGLSIHRGHMECNDVTDKLKVEHPEIYELLDKTYKFKDRRIKCSS